MVSIDHFQVEIRRFYQYKYWHFQIDKLVFLQMFDSVLVEIAYYFQQLSFQQDL